MVKKFNSMNLINETIISSPSGEMPKAEGVITLNA